MKLYLRALFFRSTLVWSTYQTRRSSPNFRRSSQIEESFFGMGVGAEPANLLSSNPLRSHKEQANESAADGT